MMKATPGDFLNDVALLNNGLINTQRMLVKNNLEITTLIAQLRSANAALEQFTFAASHHNAIVNTPAAHKEILNFFKRLNTPDAYSGTGIGLATCEKIAPRHGGNIQRGSEEGKGSRFYFTRPKGRII